VLDATTFANHHPGGEGLILNYRSKDITQEMKGHFPLSLKMANTMVIGTIEKEIRRVIDPTKALMPQIWSMDHESYLKLVESPHWLFVESPRMFEYDWAELFSHNQWYAIYPVPLIALYLILSNIGEYQLMNPIYYVLMAIAGLLMWTFTEYCLHRFIFHSEKHLFDNRLLRYLHFILHGIHHMMPIDP
jgi:4-hydroxysphinganine ceramide fatty acyl 2-hydroxylase